MVLFPPLPSLLCSQTPAELRLKTTNRLWCDMLHEGVVFSNCPRLMYIGMQDQWFTFNMFDTQAWYARDVILGKLTLPNRAIMDTEFAKWRAAEEAIEATDEANIRYQANYVQRLIDMTDYPSFNIEGVVQTFMEWEVRFFVLIVFFFFLITHQLPSTIKKMCTESFSSFLFLFLFLFF